MTSGGDSARWHASSRPALTTHLSAITQNTSTLRSRTTSELMAVVKADGYGLGAVAVASAALAGGATWLGTTTVVEAAALRDAGFAVPILCWLDASGTDVDYAVQHDIDLAVGSIEALRDVAARGRGSRVHLHLDIGMARGGADPSTWHELFEIAQQEEHAGRVAVVGVMGHLPHADAAVAEANVAGLTLMDRGLRMIYDAGLDPDAVHLATTSAVLNDRRSHATLVRTGAGLVGIDPSGRHQLTGSATLTAPILHTRAAPAGTPVGYDGSYVTRTASHLSVIGLGYADGVPRNLDAGAQVGIEGRRHHIVGRVSMDQMVVETGDIAYPRGTTAHIFSPDPEIGPSIQEWATWAATIPHTIVAGIGRRVERRTR